MPRVNAAHRFEVEIEVVQFQDDDDLTLRKRHGRAQFDDVTLTKGYLVSDALQNWWETACAGQYDRKDISIILKHNAGYHIRSWNLYGCWPRQWRTGPLDGNVSSNFYEKITAAVENMQVQSSRGVARGDPNIRQAMSSEADRAGIAFLALWSEG